MSDLHAAERIKAEAMSIFNDPPQETSQDVRDVIEWYHAQLRIELARAALSAPAVAQWMPIETAPKDEQVLLRVEARFHKRAAYFAAQGYWMHSSWVIFNADEAVQRVEPTHWQPLPAAPSAKEPQT